MGDRKGDVLRESTFNSEIVNSLWDRGHWSYKIPDMPVSMTLGLRFSPEHPCDIVAFIYGIGVAIEGKMLKKFEAFGLRHMRQSQVEHFDRIIQYGSGRAFVFLNIRQRADKDKKLEYENRLIILEWEIYGERIKAGESIKKDELFKMPFIRGKKGRFDLSDFCNEIGEWRVEQYD